MQRKRPNQVEAWSRRRTHRYTSSGLDHLIGRASPVAAICSPSICGSGRSSVLRNASIEMCRGAAAYVDRILRGARQADLPVQAPTGSSSSSTEDHKALGLDVPPTLRPRRRGWANRRETGRQREFRRRNFDWPRALPRYRPCRVSRGRKPIRRGRRA